MVPTVQHRVDKLCFQGGETPIPLGGELLPCALPSCRPRSHLCPSSPLEFGEHQLRARTAISEGVQRCISLPVACGSAPLNSRIPASLMRSIVLAIATALVTTSQFWGMFCTKPDVWHSPPRHPLLFHRSWGQYYEFLGWCSICSLRPPMSKLVPGHC